MAVVLAALVLMCASSGRALSQQPTKWKGEVERLTSPIIKAKLVPGLVVGVYDNGTVETYGFGTISPEQPRTPDGRTIYEIGSISKVFTAVLLADAEGRGEVAIGDALGKYLPKGVAAPEREKIGITLEHLASHRSGLPRVPGDMEGGDLRDPYAAYGRDRLYAAVNIVGLESTPGTMVAYSNFGAGLLGQVLADRAGMTHERLLQERIAGPLKMTDTTTGLDPAKKDRIAQGSRSGLATPPWMFDGLAGCGAIRSTTDDLMKFAAAQIKPDGTALKEALRKVTARRAALNDRPGWIALGWFIAGDGSTLWHNGQTGGFSSALYVSPQMGKAAVVLAGGADSTIDVLGERLIQTLCGMKVQPPGVRPSIDLPPADLERLVGKYDSPLGYTITITRSEAALFAQITGQSALRVYPESATNFFYRDVEAELVFESPADGSNASAVTLHQNGREIRCERSK